MSFEKVKKYFNGVGLGDRVVVREHIGDTVEHAAMSVGCKPGRIVKTMSFLVKDEPVLIAVAGDAKISNSKFKACFNQKATMIPAQQVETLTGHVPGAVCPFAANESVRIFLDVSLKRFDTIHTAGGSLNATVTLSLEELEEHSAPAGWVDVCNGWYVNEILP